MKRAIIAMTAIAAAYSLASCNKEPFVEPGGNNTPTEGSCIITASTESAYTKTALRGDDTSGYEVVWSKGDSFVIGGKTFTLTDGENTTNGTFKGDAPADKEYTVYYPSAYNGTDWPASQTYTADNITGSPMKATVTVSGGKVAEPLSFKNVGGILRLTLKGNVKVTSIIVSANGLKDITLDCPGGALLNETDGTAFHIAMPEGSYTGTSILFRASDGKSCIKTLKSDKPLVIKPSEITPASIRIDNWSSSAPEGALSGLFTVSDDGNGNVRKVYFARGNMYWDGDSFEFETNQMDYASTWQENHVSHFFWSKAKANSYTQYYSDTEASEDDVFFTNATYTTSNQSFTANGQTGVWRTLSKDEWQYLIGHNGSVITTIDGVSGLIIFCDEYKGIKTGLTEIPEGCAFLPAAGYRNGSSGQIGLDSQSAGYYFSSVGGLFESGHCAYNLVFSESHPSQLELQFRDRIGSSVRLATEVSGDPILAFNVTFDMNGHGTAPDDINEVPYRSKISKPEYIPTTEGYAFVGWYKDKGCKTLWDFDSDIVTANTTLYAGWVAKPAGALSGLFTINKAGDQVHFSQGNLYWDGNSFEFETNQMDYASTWQENHVSHFFWSKDASKACGNKYTDSVSEGDVFFTNSPGFTVNGQKDIWRTLSGDEWNFILGASGNEPGMDYRNTVNRFAEATVDGVKGLLIFPDVFEWTASMGDEPDFNKKETFITVFSNTYTADNFTAMQNAGVVFLPSAGHYYKENINKPDYGWYWSSTLTSTSGEAGSANSFFFGDKINPGGSDHLDYGFCVRLVTGQSGNPTPAYTVTFDAKGHGNAPGTLYQVPYGSTLTKPSDLTAEGYCFGGWYKDEACLEAWNFATDVVTANTTLYAKWRLVGTLSGSFTVDASGKRVYFSQGNLYWNGDTFEFETGQYDFNNDYITSHISHFLWSKNEKVAIAKDYMDPIAADNDIFFTNDGQTSPKANFIVNGQKGKWRTLSKDEWQYLIDHNGSAWATLGDIGGLVIFCDEYKGSKTDLTGIPEGCAFLPAAGCRSYNGYTIFDAGYCGYYWASVPGARIVFKSLESYSSDHTSSDALFNDNVSFAALSSDDRCSVTVSSNDTRSVASAVRLVTEEN